MQEGYNMNIRSNLQTFMFYKDRSIDFSVRLCREYALSTFGDFHLPPGTFWDFHLTPIGIFRDFHFTAQHYGDSHITIRWTEKGRFHRHRKLNFRCWREKKIFIMQKALI